MNGDIAFQSASIISTTGGDLTITPTGYSLNVTLTANDTDAFDLSDGTTSYYKIDTRTGVDNPIHHSFDATNMLDVTSDSSMTNVLMRLRARILDLNGGVSVDAADFIQLDIEPLTITANQATTVAESFGLRVVAPTESSNITLTTAVGLRILNAAGSPTNQHGILINTMTAGATADYAITIGTSDNDQNLIHVGVTGDPIFGWAEGADGRGSAWGLRAFVW